jgi:hypothetical protein
VLNQQLPRLRKSLQSNFLENGFSASSDGPPSGKPYFDKIPIHEHKLCLLWQLGRFALHVGGGAEKMAGVSKNTKLWLTFAGTAALYLIWKFIFNFWPLG